MDHLLNATLLAVGAGVAAEEVVKSKRPWIFQEAMKDRYGVL